MRENFRSGHNFQLSEDVFTCSPPAWEWDTLYFTQYSATCLPLPFHLPPGCWARSKGGTFALCLWNEICSLVADFLSHTKSHIQQGGLWADTSALEIPLGLSAFLRIKGPWKCEELMMVQTGMGRSSGPPPVISNAKDRTAWNHLYSSTLGQHKIDTAFSAAPHWTKAVRDQHTEFPKERDSSSKHCTNLTHCTMLLYLLWPLFRQFTWSQLICGCRP